MDFLQFIKLVSIAKWLKYVSLTFVIGFLGVAGYITFIGLQNQDNNTLQAGTSLLGIVLPLFLFIGFISFYESGIKPLQKATAKVLNEFIPSALQQIRINDQSLSSVITTPIRDCVALYQINLHSQISSISLLFRIELNVYKLNLAILLPAEKVNGNFSTIAQLLSHSLAGSEKEGYTTNKKLSESIHDSHQYAELVLYRELPKDFLWNSAEKLYFTQDLVLFISSLLQEGKHLFEPAAKNQ